MAESVYEFPVSDVCSRSMRVALEGDTLEKVAIVGGCPGNTQAVCRLLEGRDVREAISLLKGIRCPGSQTGDTSCPDQLAKGLEAILASRK